MRFIDKWNGGTFGGAQNTGDKFYPWIAQIAKATNRPVKLMLTKSQEMAFLQVKPQTLTKFKIGAMKDGKITACQREFHVNSGANLNEGPRDGRRQVRAVRSRGSQLEGDRLPLSGPIRSTPARPAAICSRSSSGPGNR